MRRSLALALLVALVAGCTIHERTKSVVLATHRGHARSVCVLFFDGLSADAFGKLLDAGVLPNLKSAIVDRGLVVRTAVASVPSETYPNLTAMLTGLFPGHHGIPANVWLDRRLRLREAHTNIFRTYSTSDFIVPEARTLYERLPADTVAITTPISKGATVVTKNLAIVLAGYMRNDWPLLDRKTIDDIGDAYAGGAAGGGTPSLVWGHLLGPDEVAHYDGADSREFRLTLSEIDRSFARLVRRLKRRGVYDDILFVLIGDHGNATYQRTVSAEELVHRALFSHPTSADCARHDCALVPEKGPFDVGEAEIAVGAYRGAMIWLPSSRPPEDLPAAFRTKRKGKKASKRRPIEPRRPISSASAFVAELARLPEIDLAVTRGDSPGRVQVYGPLGRAEIVREDGDEEPSRYLYRVVEGTDPLGYARELRDVPLSSEDWLRLTSDSRYPDLVVQLAEFFDSPRSPDVFISPRDGYGFREGRAGGHGGLSRLETVVPLIFAGPGVTPGTLPVARTVDLAPTLLSYLGVEYDPAAMDGDDLMIGQARP